ncbi:spe-46, partial [Pristionchus pacificus]
LILPSFALRALVSSGRHLSRGAKKSIMLTEIADRVHEQMWTTAETMRRRAVAAGDSVLKLGDKVRVAGDRLRDVSEPAYLDLKDYVSSAVEDTKPFEELVEDDRHTLIEMYLGTSVLLIGLSLGELTGSSSLIVPVMDYLFSPYATFALLVLLPTRFGLLLKKTAMDDTERRTSIFVLSFLMGILGSFTFGGPRLLALAPSLLFLTPTVLALTIDNQIICVPKGFDRHKILMGGATLSLVLSTVLAYFPIGHLHKTTLLYFGAHAAFLFVHAQVSSARLKDKSLCQGVGQLLYVVGVFAIQLLLSAFSG